MIKGSAEEQSPFLLPCASDEKNVQAECAKLRTCVHDIRAILAREVQVYENLLCTFLQGRILSLQVREPEYEAGHDEKEEQQWITRSGLPN